MESWLEFVLGYEVGTKRKGVADYFWSSYLGGINAWLLLRSCVFV